MYVSEMYRTSISRVVQPWGKNGPRLGVLKRSSSYTISASSKSKATAVRLKVLNLVELRIPRCTTSLINEAMLMSGFFLAVF